MIVYQIENKCYNGNSKIVSPKDIIPVNWTSQQPDEVAYSEGKVIYMGDRGWEVHDEKPVKVITPPPDTKTYLHLESDKEKITANGIDTATITATLKDSEDNVVDYTGNVFALIQGYGAKEVNFTNGMATIELTVPAEKSGKLTFGNDDTTIYTMKNELIIWAVV